MTNEGCSERASWKELPPLILLSLSLERTCFPSLSYERELVTGDPDPDRQVVRMWIRDSRSAPGQVPEEIDVMSRIVSGKYPDVRVLLHHRLNGERRPERIVAWRAGNSQGRIRLIDTVPWDNVPGTEMKNFDFLVTNLDHWEFTTVGAPNQPICGPEHDRVPFQVIRQERRKTQDPAPEREPDCIFRWIETTKCRELEHRIEHWRGGRHLRTITSSDWRKIGTRSRYLPFEQSYRDEATGRCTRATFVKEPSLAHLCRSDMHLARLMTRT